MIAPGPAFALENTPDILHTIGSVCLAVFSHKPGQPVLFQATPLCIHQHDKANFKGNGLELYICQLGGECLCYDAQVHFLQFAYSFITQNAYFLLL